MELPLCNADEFGASEDQKSAFRHRPIDLAHLSRYTTGNTVLEREVLGRFRRQSKVCLQKLHAATGDDEWRDAIRVLKTSARDAGAWRVLATAEIAGQMASLPAQSVRDELLAGLGQQIEEANSFIGSVLS